MNGWEAMAVPSHPDTRTFWWIELLLEGNLVLRGKL
jgi:hypothetical protein